MGYESRIIIVERTDFGENIFGDRHIYAEEIAQLNLCKMGAEEVNGRTFRELFRTEIDFNLVVDRDFTREDDYREYCKYTDLDTVIEWLKASKTAKEYRRAKMLLEVLEGFKKCKEDYGEICLVHYGY